VHNVIHSCEQLSHLPHVYATHHITMFGNSLTSADYSALMI